MIAFIGRGLVAHRGEERALRPVGILRGIPGPLRVAVELGIVDRDSRLLGQTDEEIQVTSVYSSLGIGLQTAIPPITSSCDISGATISRSIVSGSVPQDPLARVARDVVDEFRLVCLEDATDHPLTEGERVGLELVGDRAASHDRPERPPVSLDEVHGARFRVQQVDRMFGDPLEHGGGIQRRRDLPSNVDEGGHLFRSVVRLAIQAGVLDRRPDASRDRREQPLFVHAEATLLRALDTDDTDRLVADRGSGPRDTTSERCRSRVSRSPRNAHRD